MKNDFEDLIREIEVIKTFVKRWINYEALIRYEKARRCKESRIFIKQNIIIKSEKFLHRSHRRKNVV